jgi:hypothetical protein
MTCVAFLGALVFLGINIYYASKNNLNAEEGDPAKTPDSPKKTPGIEIRGFPISHHTLRTWPPFLRSASMRNGTLISALSMVVPSDSLIPSLELIWDFISFVSRFISFCRAVSYL